MKIKANDVAVVGMTTALLLAGQLALSAVSGVEIVTVLLLCFSYSFGIGRGMSAATAFSLLRCLLFGISVPVLLLYLIYYNAFAVLFGFLGERAFSKKTEIVCTEILFAVLLAAATIFLSGVIRVSPLLKKGTDAIAVVLLVIVGVAAAAYNGLLLFGKRISGVDAAKKTVSVTALAAVCTICFSLLDDVITPLFYGYDARTASAYFYTSFLAMLPQTLCTICTVGTLFLPLVKIFDKGAKKTVK